MQSFVNKYAKDITYSQNGEEGILIECLSRMGITKGHAVEIGANDGKWCSNTALLIEKGWTAKMVEADFDLWTKCCANWQGNNRVKAQCTRVDAYNINAFVDDKCDVLSIDTDGLDFKLFEALKAKPKIVIVEIDSSIPPDKTGFNAEGGSSYRSMVELGISKGYFLLCHTGNLVFVDAEFQELFPEIEGDPLTDTKEYFKTAWLQ
jgi:hypothetical protein